MEKALQIERNKDTLVAGLEIGSVAKITLNDESTLTGTVLRNIFCCEGQVSWRLLSINLNGQEFTVDSRNIKSVDKCIKSFNENDKIVCKDMCEIYGVEYGLSDTEFLKSVTERWNELDDEDKENLSAILAPCLTADVLADILGAYTVLKQQNTELHDKLMDSYTERAKMINEKDSPDILKSLNNLIVGSVMVLGLASAVSKIED